MIERILDLIKERGITAYRLTNDLGLSKGAVSQWKSGHNKPGIDVVVKLAKYFGVTTDYLLTGKEGGSAVYKEDIEINLCDIVENDVNLRDCISRNLPIYTSTAIEFLLYIYEQAKKQIGSDVEHNDYIAIAPSEKTEENAFLNTCFHLLYKRKYIHIVDNNTKSLRVIEEGWEFVSISDNSNVLFLFEIETLNNIKAYLKDESKKQLSDYFSITAVPIAGKDQSPLEALGHNSEVFEVEERIPIPIYGIVAAGYEDVALEDLLGYESFDASSLRGGQLEDYFCLRVKGDSMSPQIMEKDLVLVKRQSDVESGQIAVVSIRNEEATVKQIRKTPKHIELVPYNRDYSIIPFFGEELNSLRIIGLVMELKRKF